MSWNDLAPLSGRKVVSKSSAVDLVISTASKRFQPCCRVVLRLGYLPDLTFIKAGGFVKVQIGAGHDLGKLRFVPGNLYRITKCNGRSGAMSIRLPLLFGMAGSRQTRFPLEHDYNDPEWLEVTLPDSLISDVPVQTLMASPASPAASKPGKPNGATGFSMGGVGDVRSVRK